MGPLHKTFNLAKACAVIECGEDRRSPRGTFTLQEAIRDSATKLLWGFMLHIWSTLACRVHHLCPALASFLITRLQPALAALIPSWPVFIFRKKAFTNLVPLQSAWLLCVPYHLSHFLLSADLFSVTASDKCLWSNHYVPAPAGSWASSSGSCLLVKRMIMGTATKRLNWSRVSESKWVADQGAQSGQGWERPLCAGGKAGALGCLQAATAWRETMSSCSCLVPGRQAWRERKPNPLIGSAETSPASTWIRSIPLQFISSSPPGVWEARLLFVQAGLKSHGCPCLLITCSYSMIY